MNYIHEISADGNSTEVTSMVDDGRIRKFILDHGNCQFFRAYLESGAGVNEIFQAGEPVSSCRSIFKLEAVKPNVCVRTICSHVDKQCRVKSACKPGSFGNR